jgi:hypothetical protein
MEYQSALMIIHNALKQSIKIDQFKQINQEQQFSI